MAKPSSSARVAWQAVSGGAGGAALGAILNILLASSHDPKTMLTWAAIGGAIGLAGGIADGAKKVTKSIDAQDETKSVKDDQPTPKP